MDLSKELIQQFIDVTTQDKEVQNGVTLYGTIKTQGSEKFVILDGSDQLTPIKATTFVSDGERVTVMIKNHQAIVTGNITSPAARQPDVEDTVGDKIAEYDVIITKTIEAQDAKIGDLVAQNVEITGDLTAVNGTIEQLKSENVEITGKLDANEAEIKKLKTDKLDAETADIKFATIENLKATNIEVNTIKGNHADFADLTTQKFEAVNANIENLEVNKLSASEADLKYANIDFANIGKAAIEHLFAQSGLIKDLVVGDQHITGELVGVTIKGDLIEGGTIVADKLVVKGSDGLYYKLNTDGMKVEAEQTEYNSLNGSIITAKSITATKVNVNDLVAFDATIGGFKITDNSIHSGVKSSVDNTTRGVYLDNTGQVAFGDGNSFLKYFKDSDGKWKLVVSANSVKLSTSSTTVEDALEDMNNKIDNTPKSVEEHFAVSSNPTTVPTSGWSINPPVWQNGKYIWSKMVTTYVDGRISESKPVCITGAKGQDGTSGSAGKGIKTVTNYYLATNVNTGVTESTSGWTETVQTITSTNKYLWNYELVTYTDNSTTKTTPVIIGAYGDKGNTGAAGSNGQDGLGIRSIVEKYAVSTSNTTTPTTWHDTVQTMTATNKYLWNYEIITYTNNTTSETSKRVIGVYGDKGNTGATGPAGKGIKTVTNYYLATNTNTGVTDTTSGWTTSIQTITATNKYLWNYELVTYTDNSTTKTTPLVIGVYGDKGQNGATGATGNGIKSITEKYAVSTSNTTAPTTWYNEVQVMTTTNKYLWNYEIVTYTNGSTSETSKRVIGVYGDKGQTGATGSTGATGPQGPAGKGVKSITNYYLVSTASSGVTTSTSGWSTTVQNMTATNRYLWNYEKVTYTDNSTTTTTPVVIGVYGDKGNTGATGATGATGNGIKSITEYYLVSANKTGITTSTSGWSTTIPTLTATNKYLWNYEVIAYTNGSSSTGSPKIIGVYGDKGQTGATGATGPTGPAGVGIKSVDVEYYLSTSSTTQSGGSWSTTAPAWVNGKYMWSRTKTVTTDGTTKYSSPACITGQKGSTGATGATGSTGATGPTGATGQGVQSITEEYYLSTSKTSQSGGSWVTTPPTWSTGKYIWTRTKIVYKNPTATVYTTPVCDSSWEAVNEIEVGGTNLTTETNKGVTGWGWGMQTGGKTISEVTENGIRCCKMVRDSVTTTGWSYISYNRIGRNKYLPNKKYTVSFEVKASIVTSFYVGLKEGNSSNPLSGDVKTGNTVANTWTKLSATITTLSSLPSSTSQVLYLHGMNSGTGVTYIFRNLKIETGTKATDWTRAPEDVDSTFDGVYDLITDKEVKITQSYQTDLQLLEKNIQLSVSETYAEKSAVSTIEKNLTSKIDQTAKDVTINFNKVNNETRGELQNFKTEVNSYIKFDEDGMELGKSNSKFKTKLTNEKLAFLEDGSEIASISNKEMSITDANITNQLTIGKFAFVPRSNGNTSLKWIG